MWVLRMAFLRRCQILWLGFGGHGCKGRCPGVFPAVMEHQDQKKVGRKGWNLLLSHITAPCRGQLGQDSNKEETYLMQSSLRLTVLLFMAYSAWVLIESGTTSPKWPYPQQSSIKKMTHNVTYSPTLRPFFSRHSLLSNESSLCQAVIKLATTERLWFHHLYHFLKSFIFIVLRLLVIKSLN